MSDTLVVGRTPRVVLSIDDHILAYTFELIFRLRVVVMFHLYSDILVSIRIRALYDTSWLVG